MTSLVLPTTKPHASRFPFSLTTSPSLATHFSPAGLLLITYPLKAVIPTYAHHSHHSFIPTEPTNFSNLATEYYPEVKSSECSAHHKGIFICGTSPDTMG